jgi:ABC-type Fe3+/spermidine/putrescine transport system ATPase subunit
MDRIDIRDFTIEYSSGGYLVRPIHGLDLQVASGELVLLLGASGSGKTTLLSALAAILRPTAGTIPSATPRSLGSGGPLSPSTGATTSGSCSRPST